MKVSLLATSNSRLAGGVYYTMSALSKGLFDNDIDISVISYDDEYSERDKHVYGDVSIRLYHTIKLPILNRIGYSKDIFSVLENYQPDIVHQQGLWMYNSVAALKYKYRHPDSIKIIEPHGMLDPWAIRNAAWKKNIVWHMYEFENLRTADCLHALCVEEYESIRSLGLRNPIAIIPNGVELPVANIRKFSHNSQKVLLYIGRIHPKKGLRELILGIAKLRSIAPNLLTPWIIRIAGWEQNGYLKSLMSLVQDYHLTDKIQFIGPVYGVEKIRELKNANAFILPSFSEGLPMSILEAWAYRLPVLMTKFCNLSIGFNSNAAVKINPTPESICEELLSFFEKTDKELFDMGKNGYQLITSYFNWPCVVKKMISLYKYFLNQASKPDFLVFD